MHNKVIILIFLFLLGCKSSLSESKGDFNEVIIVSSIEDREIIEPILDEYMFDDFLYTPEPERVYKKTWINPEGFDYYKEFSNIIIISLNDPPDKTIDSLFYYMDNNVISYPSTVNDLYSKPQNITLIKSTDKNNLSADLDKTIDEIKRNINTNIDTLYNKRYLSKNITNNDYIDSIARCVSNHTFKFDSNYKVIKYNQKNNFLWIGKGSIMYDNSASYQWVIIKETELKEINGNLELYNFFNEHIKEIDMHINLINDYNQFDITKTDSLILFHQKMLYNHSLYRAGGPISAFLLQNHSSNKSLLIYGLVNAPGKSKLKLIKELESIIKNSIF